MSDDATGMAEAERRIAAEATQRTGSLDLFNLGLDELPESLFRLTHLRVLDLGAKPNWEEEHRSNGVQRQRARLAALTGLEELRLGFSDLGSLDFAAGLPRLRVLDCQHTLVTDLAPLAGLTSLQSVNCSGTLVAELAPLTGLLALRSLHCAGSQVTSLTSLAGLTSLMILDCSYTKVSDLSPLLSTKSIIYLACRNTEVCSIPNNTRWLPDLRKLDLSNNQIEDLPRSLGYQKWLGIDPDTTHVDGHGLHLEGNPLRFPLSQLVKLRQPLASHSVIAWLRGELDQETLEALRAEDDAQHSIAPFESLPDLPAQGTGGQVVIDLTGVIATAPPGDLDVEGNNLRRLRSLQPDLCELARTLREALDRPNRPFDILVNRIDAYLAALDRPLAEVNLDQIFKLGVRLENTLGATRRQIAAKELPDVDLVADEAAESLLEFHAHFIVSTRIGQEALDEAPRYRLPAEELAEFRSALNAFVGATQDVPTIIRSEVAREMRANAPEVGVGMHPDRSTLVGAGMARNVALTTVAAGLAYTVTAVPVALLGPAGHVVGGPATLLAVEALKKSKAFAAVIKPFHDYLDRAAASGAPDPLHALQQHRDFSLRIEPILRRLAVFRGPFGFLNRALDRMRAPPKS